MASFYVEWSCEDVVAETPREAAEIARRLIAEGKALKFTVIDSDETEDGQEVWNMVDVDLNEPEETPEVAPALPQIDLEDWLGKNSA